MSSCVAGVAIALAMSVGAPSSQAKAPNGHYNVVAGGVLDTRTALTWQVPASMSAAWEGAKTYCGTLGAGWRLPTLKELQTLVDYSAVEHPPVDPLFADTLRLQYWSSTPMRGSSDYAWTVSFEYGETLKDQRTNVHNVRCVR